MFDPSQVPHTLVNEDGHKWNHEGYATDACKVCGRNYVIARNRRKEYHTCGRKDCDNQPLYI